MNTSAISLSAVFVDKKPHMKMTFSLWVQYLWSYRAFRIMTVPIWGVFWLLANLLFVWFPEVLVHAWNLYGEILLATTFSFLLLFLLYVGVVYC